VLTYGVQKYEEWNWSKGDKYSRYIDSLERHINDWKSGEDFDQESRLHHMGHAAWNCLCLFWFQRYNKGIDDRVKMGARLLEYAADVTPREYPLNIPSGTVLTVQQVRRLLDMGYTGAYSPAHTSPVVKHATKTIVASAQMWTQLNRELGKD
jgi:hypothetical protein